MLTKLSTVVFMSTFLSNGVLGFSMISPRFSDFPKRFSSYLKEIDEIFDQDWPVTFFEKGEWKDDKKPFFRSSSPRYEVVDDEDKFQITVEIPSDFNSKDIGVELKAGGRILSIHGSQEKTEKGHFMSSSFHQNFSLDPSVDIQMMKADMTDDGMLLVTAPRVGKELPASRSIPIKMVEGKKLKDRKEKGSVKMVEDIESNDREDKESDDKTKDAAETKEAMHP